MSSAWVLKRHTCAHRCSYINMVLIDPTFISFPYKLYQLYQIFPTWFCAGKVGEIHKLLKTAWLGKNNTEITPPLVQQLLGQGILFNEKVTISYSIVDKFYGKCSKWVNFFHLFNFILLAGALVVSSLLSTTVRCDPREAKPNDISTSSAHDGFWFSKGCRICSGCS